MIIDMFEEMNTLADELEKKVPGHELLRFNNASVGRARWTDSLRKEFLDRFDDDDSIVGSSLAVYVHALKEALGQKAN